MGFLDRAIRRGISEGVGKAVGEAVEKAVAPKATEYANRTAEQLDQAAQGTAQQTTQAASGLNGAFANLQRAAEGYATEMSKNMKICPACGQPAGADKKFCPSCGAKLPEETVAQGAVCPSCGKQNSIGTKFCQDCGTKLPSAVAEEQAVQAKNDAALSEWDQLLPQYPKWNCGGKEIEFDTQNNGSTDYVILNISFGKGGNGEPALNQYRQLLIQNGFHQAGQYPSVSQLFKKIDGVCYCFNSENCFDGGMDCLTVYFVKQEPTGGYDYVKPEPKKPTSFKDLFNL